MSSDMIEPLITEEEKEILIEIDDHQTKADSYDDEQMYGYAQAKQEVFDDEVIDILEVLAPKDNFNPELPQDKIEDLLRKLIDPDEEDTRQKLQNHKNKLASRREIYDNIIGLPLLAAFAMAIATCSTIFKAYPIGLTGINKVEDNLSLFDEQSCPINFHTFISEINKVQEFPQKSQKRLEAITWIFIGLFWFAEWFIIIQLKELRNPHKRIHNTLISIAIPFQTTLWIIVYCLLILRNSILNKLVDNSNVMIDQCLLNGQSIEIDWFTASDNGQPETSRAAYIVPLVLLIIRLCVNTFYFLCDCYPTRKIWKIDDILNVPVLPSAIMNDI